MRLWRDFPPGVCAEESAMLLLVDMALTRDTQVMSIKHGSSHS